MPFLGCLQKDRGNEKCQGCPSEITQMNRFDRIVAGAKVASVWKKAVWTLAVLIALAFVNQTIMSAVMGVVPWLLQMMMYMGMSIMQFYGLMYFLAGAKVIKVLPGKKGTYLTLDDYKGNPQLELRLREWLEDLQGTSALQAMGGRPPGGVLLIGEPGVGKSYALKCLAGEGQIPFLMIDASQLVSMWMGVGILKIMTFAKAGRKHARVYGSCVIVIDEIDAIAKSRGNVMGAGMMAGGMMGGMMGIGVLNRLLTEMDGLNEDAMKGKLKGRLLWVGCTNRPDILDPALVREGRFDIIQVVEPPNFNGRIDILKYYLGKMQTADDLDFREMAYLTTGLVPSALEAAVRIYAARAAVREGIGIIYQRHMVAAIFNRYWGDASDIEIKQAEREYTALHEVGHAAVGLELMPDFQITGITCSPHLGARTFHRTLGMTRFGEEVPTRAPTMEQVLAQIAMGLGGMAAMRVYRDTWTVGAANDMKSVNRLVDMLQGVGYFGLRVKSPPPLPVPAGGCGTVMPGMPGAPDIEKRKQIVLEEQYNKAVAIIKHHDRFVNIFTAKLLEQGDMSWEQIRGLWDKYKNTEEVNYEEDSSE